MYVKMPWIIRTSQELRTCRRIPKLEITTCSDLHNREIIAMKRQFSQMYQVMNLLTKIHQNHLLLFIQRMITYLKLLSYFHLVVIVHPGLALSPIHSDIIHG